MVRAVRPAERRSARRASLSPPHAARRSLAQQAASLEGASSLFGPLSSGREPSAAAASEPSGSSSLPREPSPCRSEKTWRLGFDRPPGVVGEEAYAASLRPKRSRSRGTKVTIKDSAALWSAAARWLSASSYTW